MTSARNREGQGGHDTRGDPSSNETPHSSPSDEKVRSPLLRGYGRSTGTGAVVVRAAVGRRTMDEGQLAGVNRFVRRQSPVTAPVPDLAAAHRQFRLDKVIGMLNAKPDIKLAVMSDGESVPDILILTIAKRGLAAFEMHMPRVKFDAWNLMTLIDRHGGRVPE